MKSGGRKKKATQTQFSKELRNVMDERNLTLVALSKLSGISKSTLSDWLAGASPSDLFAVKKLADALNVSMAFLTTGEHDAAIFSIRPGLADVLIPGEAQEGIFRIVWQRLEHKAR